MKLVILWEYYPRYLDQLRDKLGPAESQDFAAQRRLLLADRNGWPPDMARYLEQHEGMDVEFIVANAEWLQRQWAMENGIRDVPVSDWKRAIALEQVRSLQPDVLWTSPYFDPSGDFAKEASCYCRRLIAWVGSPFEHEADVSSFSALLTENAATMAAQQGTFEKVIVTKPGFDRTILDEMGDVTKSRGIVFSGQLTLEHTRRIDILAFLLARKVAVDIFSDISVPVPPSAWKMLRDSAWYLRHGSMADARDQIRGVFDPGSPDVGVGRMCRHAQPAVYGLDMYRLLASARLSLNIHIDVAGNHAGNMRMFEATGVGSCLITEHADNISDLFEPGTEVLTYSSKEELKHLLGEMLECEDQVAQIAARGQQRTLQDHTLERMWSDIRPAFYQ